MTSSTTGATARATFLDRRRSHAVRGVALLAALAGSGCLSGTHEIPREELMELSRRPAEARAEGVRVVQQFGYESEPPAAPHVHVGTHVVVDGPVWSSGRPRPAGRARDHTSDGRGLSRGSDLGQAKKESAKAWLLIAAGVAVGLAATEGARYDGWVDLHPMHPVHLLGPDGQYTYLPLAQITPDAASWAERAYVRDTEGPWNPVERRPLDRQGFTYSVYGGGGQIPLVDAESRVGFLGHIGLGYFPTRTVGIGLDLAYGWTDDRAMNTVFDARYALEIEAFPVKAGPLHGGVFGQVGGASRSDDGVKVDDGSSLLGAGVLLQLDLTTYLALTARAGMLRAHNENLGDVGLGISIY